MGYNPSYKWTNPTYPIHNQGCNPLTKWDEPPSRNHHWISGKFVTNYRNSPHISAGLSLPRFPVFRFSRKNQSIVFLIIHHLWLWNSWWSHHGILWGTPMGFRWRPECDSMPSRRCASLRAVVSTYQTSLRWGKSLGSLWYNMIYINNVYIYTRVCIYICINVYYTYIYYTYIYYIYIYIIWYDTIWYYLWYVMKIWYEINHDDYNIFNNT